MRICLDTSAGPEPNYRAFRMSRSTKAGSTKAVCAARRRLGAPQPAGCVCCGGMERWRRCWSCRPSWRAEPWARCAAVGASLSTAVCSYGATCRQRPPAWSAPERAPRLAVCRSAGRSGAAHTRVAWRAWAQAAEAQPSRADKGVGGEALQALEAQLQRVSEDAAVDRQQLLTTTNLLDTLSSKVRRLAVLPRRGTRRAASRITAALACVPRADRRAGGARRRRARAAAGRCSSSAAAWRRARGPHGAARRAAGRGPRRLAGVARGSGVQGRGRRCCSGEGAPLRFLSLAPGREDSSTTAHALSHPWSTRTPRAHPCSPSAHR